MAELTIGFGKTIEIFVLTLLGALPLGLIISFGSMSKFKPLKAVVRFMIWVIRGTPLMLQLIVVYYGPGLIFGTNIWGIGNEGRFVAVLAAFIINYAFYFSEIYRGGIESIPKGQYEAAAALGLTRAQTFFRVILPQVIKRVIPPTGSEFMVLVKDTALAQIIAQPQLFDIAIKTAAKNVSITPYIAAGIFYLIMSAVVEFAFKKLESKLDYYR